jgi:hypothetical protein
MRCVASLQHLLQYDIEAVELQQWAGRRTKAPHRYRVSSRVEDRQMASCMDRSCDYIGV